jgi:hypothetical protein
MKKCSVVVLVLVPLVLGFPSASPACSIGPELFGLSARADAILLVRIDGVENPVPPLRGEWDENDDHFEENSVTLHVLETWKGPAMSEVRMQVFDTSGYKVGALMVAFLETGETRTASNEEALTYWETDEPEQLAVRAEALERNRRYAAWSAGRWFVAGTVSATVAFPREQDVDAIKGLVLAAARLQSEGRVDPRGWRDWFVTAAERRATRYEGLWILQIDLLPPDLPPVDSDVQEISNDLEIGADETAVESEASAPPEPLTEEQLARLAAGFASEPAVDASDAAMLQLLADYPDLEVDRTAASVVEAGLLLRPIPAWVTKMVELTLARYGDVFADRIGRDDVDKEGRPIHTGEGENTLPTIWEVARRDLGIPSVAPAELPE